MCNQKSVEGGRAQARFSSLALTITEHCNFSCRHCFHSADNQTPRDEFTLEEVWPLLDEAKECGIKSIELTGGEPTVYPYLREVIQGIYERGMKLTTIVTNGSFLTEDLLAFIKERFSNTSFRISFDGIGHHDWLRRSRGAEEKALEAIRRCLDRDFPVYINMNVNRRNREVIAGSVRMLANMGVQGVRIIKTTEAPRWKLNQEGDSLSLPEYFDFCLEYAQKYREDKILIPVIMWQCLYLQGFLCQYAALTVKGRSCDFREEDPLCFLTSKRVCVQANGDLLPCSPASGLYALYGIHYGNVKKEGLKKLLKDSPYLDDILQTTGEKIRENPKCASCSYARACRGGCPLLSLLLKGSFLECDPFKCEFFEGGYYERLCQIMEGWENMLPI